MFLVINLLAIAYGGVQVYQFRGFGDECDKITMVGYLALANVSAHVHVHVYCNSKSPVARDLWSKNIRVRGR